jgi:hypothetical protein
VQPDGGPQPLCGLFGDLGCDLPVGRAPQLVPGLDHRGGGLGLSLWDVPVPVPVPVAVSVPVHAVAVTVILDVVQVVDIIEIIDRVVVVIIVVLDVALTVIVVVIVVVVVVAVSQSVDHSIVIARCHITVSLCLGVVAVVAVPPVVPVAAVIAIISKIVTFIIHIHIIVADMAADVTVPSVMVVPVIVHVRVGCFRPFVTTSEAMRGIGGECLESRGRI